MSKKTREVFPVAQVAHLWANQSQATARDSNGRIFFDGAVLFSYRRSYAIGAFSPWADESGRRMIFTRRDQYSVTTGRHMGYMRGALRGHPVRLVEFNPGRRIGAAAAPELAEMIRAADDFQAREGERIAKGDSTTARAFAASLINEARGFAADALDKIAPGRIAWQYRQAAELVATARLILDRVGASLKGDDKKQHAKDARIIRAAEPELPAGFIDRAMIEDTAPAYPHWDDPNRAAIVAERDAIEARAAACVPGDPEELSRALWRTQRDARKESERAARLARLVESAKRDADNLKKQNRAADRLESAERGARTYHQADRMARSFKMPADVRAKYRAAARRLEAIAERERPAAAIEKGAHLAEMIRASRRVVMESMARGRRDNSRRVAMANGETWRGANFSGDGWRRIIEGARGSLFKLRALRAVLDSTQGAADPVRAADDAAKARAADYMSNGHWPRIAADLVATAHGRTRHAKDARRILAELARVAPLAVDEIAHAENRAIGRETAARMIENGARMRLAMRPDVIARDAYTAARNLADHLRAYCAPQDMARPDVARNLAPRIAYPSREDLRLALTLAEALRDAEKVAARVNGAILAAGENGEGAAAMRRAADLLAGGMVFDAERNATRAVSGLLDVHAEIMRVIEQARDVAGRDSVPDSVAAAWRAAGESAAAAIDDCAARLAEARNLAAACEMAAATARADRVAHWRATGEGARELAHMGAVHFRRAADGDIHSTLGAIVSESAGRRLWALIRATVAAGQDRTWSYGEGPRVGHFRLERIGADGSAKVGCHLISAAEARAFAEHMCWPPFGAATAEDCAEAAEVGA